MRQGFDFPLINVLIDLLNQYKIRYKFRLLINITLLCLRYRTTLRFDFLHTFKWSALIIHRIPKFQDSQLSMQNFTCVNIKPRKNKAKTEVNDIFVG